jgi:hypothetical protein
MFIMRPYFMWLGRNIGASSRAFAVLMAAAGLAIAGCGGGGGDNTKTTAATASCDSKGINNTVGNTGTCIRDGITYTVVNKNQVLQLEQLDAKFVSMQIEQSVTESPKRKAVANAGGQYVVVALQVKNKLDSPTRFGGPGFEQAELAIGGHQYPEGASATTLLRTDFLGHGPLGAGKTFTGSVAFEVPTKLAENLAKEKAVLAISNFNDAGKIDTTKRLGIIRLWK